MHAELGLEVPGVPCTHGPGGGCLKSARGKEEGIAEHSGILAAVLHARVVVMAFQPLLLSAFDTPLNKKLA